MRAQSIVSAFSVILGNFALHVTLAIMSYAVDVPSSAHFNEAVAEADGQQCVSVVELKKSLSFIFQIHLWSAIILFYISIHQAVWTKIFEFVYGNRCFGFNPNDRIVSAATKEVFLKYAENVLEVNRVI